MIYQVVVYFGIEVDDEAALIAAAETELADLGPGLGVGVGVALSTFVAAGLRHATAGPWPHSSTHVDEFFVPTDGIIRRTPDTRP